MSKHGHSGKDVNDIKPPFEDAFGNLTVHVQVTGEQVVFRCAYREITKPGGVRVESTMNALLAFENWLNEAMYANMRTSRYPIDYDGGFFEASAVIGNVTLTEAFDSEHDYPGAEWPDPKNIVLSANGARALAAWVRMGGYKNEE